MENEQTSWNLLGPLCGLLEPSWTILRPSWAILRPVPAVAAPSPPRRRFVAARRLGLCVGSGGAVQAVAAPSPLAVSLPWPYVSPTPPHACISTILAFHLRCYCYVPAESTKRLQSVRGELWYHS